MAVVRGRTVKDAGNSFDVTLGSGGTAGPGVWQDTFDYDAVGVIAKCAADTTVTVEWADDPDVSGVLFTQTVTVFGGTPRQRTLEPKARWVRVTVDDTGGGGDVTVVTTLHPRDPAWDEPDVDCPLPVSTRDGSRLAFKVTSLGADEEVYSDWIDTSSLGSLLPFAFGDQQLATIELEWSADGSTPDAGLLSTTDLSGSEELTSGFYVYIDVPTTMIRRYVRLHIVNGATPQTTFEADLWSYGQGTYPYTMGGLDDDLSNLSAALLTRSVIAGQRQDGSLANLRISPTDALATYNERLRPTQTGSQFVEGILDHVTLIFSRDKQDEAVTHLVDVSPTPHDIELDADEGQAVFHTEATPGNVCYHETDKTLRYDEAAHMLRWEMTGEADLTNFVGAAGDARIDFGVGEDDGAGDLLNAIHYRIRVDAGVAKLYACRTKAGVLVSEVEQGDFNRDTLDAAARSLFRAAGAPATHDPEKNNYYGGSFEWLGAAPIDYFVQTPTGIVLDAHVEEFPNSGKGTTIPEPNVPLFVRVQNDSTDGGRIEFKVGSMRGGTHSNKAVQVGRNPNDDLTDIPAGGVLPGYEYFTEALSAAQTFTGPAVNVTGQVSVYGFVESDQVSGSEGVVGEFSNTEDFAVVTNTVVFTYSSDDVGKPLFVATPARDGWFRLKFTNGGTAATLSGQMSASPVAIQSPLSPIRSNIDPGNLSTVSRAVLSALDENSPDTTVREMYGTANGSLNTNLAESNADVQSKSCDLHTHHSVNAPATGSPVRLDTSPPTDRRYITIGNAGSKTIYYRIDDASGWTVGVPVPPDSVVQEEVTASNAVYVYSSSGSQPVHGISHAGAV